jgi:group I intron endonuclease
MGHIYMLKNKINGKIYIGQTTRPIQTRLKEHETGKNIHCQGIYNAIRKYGWKNFETDYYECPDEDLNFDENLLVREMGTLSPGGYNLMEGGGSGGKHSKESIQKMREARLGEKNHNYGKTPSEETRQKLREANLGKTLSEETKEKISKAKIGKTLSQESKQKMSDSKKGDKNHGSKRVYQYDLAGKLIGSFGSCGEAARYINKDRPNISACASGERKTAYRFKWSYTKL